MNIELRIARRLFNGKDNANSLSKPIARIAVGGIALGVAVMMISISVVIGFKREISNKAAGFDAHVKVIDQRHESHEQSSIVIDQHLLASIQGLNKVHYAQAYVQIQGLVQFKDVFSGFVGKAVPNSYLDKVLKPYLLQKPTNASDLGASWCYISKTLADRLKVKVGQSLQIFVVRKGKNASLRKIKLTGLYHTGIPEFDKHFVFLPLSWAQQVKKEGFDIGLYQKLEQNSLNAIVISGGDVQDFSFEWSDNFLGPIRPMPLKPDSSLQLKVRHKIKGDSLSFNIQDFKSGGSFKSTHNQHVDGMEVFLSDYNELSSFLTELDVLLPLNLGWISMQMQSPEIFNWLEILDVNVYIIIALLAAVAFINMSSALLIIILERARFIGLMKSLGASGMMLQKTFLWYACMMVWRGLIWGNVLAFALLSFQYFGQIFALPEDQYYLKYVPVSWEWWAFAGLDAAVLLSSFLLLLIPTFLISKMNPLKVIRYE